MIDPFIVADTVIVVLPSSWVLLLLFWPLKLFLFFVNFTAFVKRFVITWLILRASASITIRRSLWSSKLILIPSPSSPFDFISAITFLIFSLISNFYLFSFKVLLSIFVISKNGGAAAAVYCQKCCCMI